MSGPIFSHASIQTAMSFSVPKIDHRGRILRPDVKEPLLPGQRCLVCFETDPAKFANCGSDGCYAVGPFAEPPDTSGFKPVRPMVSAFDLARRMRAKALNLDWDADELRDKLLKRARELEKGDTAEVPEEDF